MMKNLKLFDKAAYLNWLPCVPQCLTVVLSDLCSVLSAGYEELVLLPLFPQLVGLHLWWPHWPHLARPQLHTPALIEG